MSTPQRPGWWARKDPATGRLHDMHGFCLGPRGPDDVELTARCDCPDPVTTGAQDADGRYMPVRHDAFIAAREAEEKKRTREALFRRQYGLLVERATILRSGHASPADISDVDARIAANDAEIAKGGS